MAMPTQNEKDLVKRNLDEAVAALVEFVVGQKVSRWPCDEDCVCGAFSLAEGFDDRIRGFIEPTVALMKDFGTLTDVKVPDGPYGVAVYQAAGNLAGAVRASLAIYNHKMIDIDEYEAEIERRRQIGLTIDPAIAETMFWWADMNDPYDILDERHHEGQSGREYFARNPGGEWVHFSDLPEATDKALWERDRRKLVFPYGLRATDPVINKPTST